MGILGMILLILLVLFIILVFCLFIKITVYVDFYKPKNEKGEFKITLSLLKGFIKKDIPIKKKQTKPREKPIKETDKPDVSFIKKVKTSYNKFLILKYTFAKTKPKLRKSLKVKRLNLNVSFGTDDAFNTGILTGSLWAGIYNVIAFISNFVSLTEPESKVNPDFENEYVEVSLNAKIESRPITLITLALNFLINYYLIKRKVSKKQEKKEKAAINYADSN